MNERITELRALENAALERFHEVDRRRHAVGWREPATAWTDAVRGPKLRAEMAACKAEVDRERQTLREIRRELKQLGGR